MEPEDQDPYQAELVDPAEAGPVVDATPAADDNGVDAEWAQYHEQEAAALHEQQVEATAAGDYDKAADLARDEAYQLQDAQGLGGHVDAQIEQAQNDQGHLETAAWDQHTADYFADGAATAPSEASAESYAATADGYASHADDAAGAASTEPLPEPEPVHDPGTDAGAGSE